MSKKNVFCILVFLGVIILGACTSQPGSQAPAFSTPEADKAVITGQLLNAKDSSPYGNTLVRLAEVYRNEQGEGAFALDLSFSPGAYTDENGYFVFNNLIPREYVVVIGDPNVDYLIITDEETGRAKIYQVSPGNILDIGVLSIDF